MTDTPDLEAESDAVMAFIRENQMSVLSESIVSLEASSPEDLPRTVHAIHGSLGSYQLYAAHERIAALARVLADPATTPESARAAQVETVAALRSEEATLRAGSEQSA
jgi:HPt (histidine-containing phosphotransfer) domain-containing protein